jgi:hypothetical protein
MKKQLYLILFLLLSISIPNVLGVNFDVHSRTLASSAGSVNSCIGNVIFYNGTGNINITGVQRNTSSTIPNCYLYNGTTDSSNDATCIGTSALIANGTFNSSGTCIFNSSMIVTPNSNFTILLDGLHTMIYGGASDNPITGNSTVITYLRGAGGTTSRDGYIRDIRGIYYNAGSGSVPSYSLSLSVNNTKNNILATSFNYNVTNSSGVTKWFGYCSSSSCSNSSMINFTNGIVYFSNVSPNIYDINRFNITFNNSVDVSVVGQSVNRNKTIYLNVWFEEGNYTTSFNVSEIPENVSLPIGFSIRDIGNIGTKRIQFVYNGTVISDGYFNTSGGFGLNFRQNSTVCTSLTDNTCLKYIVFGGEPLLNNTGDIQSVINGLNGSVDEIISSGVSSTTNVTAFENPFFIGLMQDPIISFSTVNVSNLFTPSVSYSMNPSTITYFDNSNLSLTFFDGDFENVSTVFLQWRVNGTLLRSISWNVTNGTQIVNDVLYAGNYSKGAVINITFWANDNLYTSANTSVSFVVGGIRPNPVTGLVCGAVNKTRIGCNWTLAVGDYVNTLIYLNGSNIGNVSNVTSSAFVDGLSSNRYYNISLFTVSADGTIGNSSSNVTFTLSNPSPNISNYTPSNLTPEFLEGTNETFSVTAVDDDGTPLIYWFKNNVFQFLGSVWTWVIGRTDEGSYNITAIVNDSYGAETRQSWNVTVLNNYPSPDTPRFSPNGGIYRTYIPFSCVSDNAFSSVDYYNILLSVNGGVYENISMNNRYGALDVDITEYNFGTNFSFNCSAVGENGVSSSLSNNFTRDYVNEFYSTTLNTNFDFKTLQSYTMSLYYDASSIENNIFVEYSFADCNGDGLYDYVYNYTTSQPSRIKQYYQCVFQKGSNNYEIGVFLSKTHGSTWAKSGCSVDYDYSDTCLLKKTYTLLVS